jgi:hypothetical protein
MSYYQPLSGITLLKLEEELDFGNKVSTTDRHYPPPTSTPQLQQSLSLPEW